MITTDDIAAAVLAGLAASAAYVAAVPGGTWNTGEDGSGGPDAPSQYPYATVRVTSQPAEWNFSSAYLQRFNATITAYVPIGDVGSDPNAAGTAIASVLFGLGGTVLRNLTEKILHCLPQQPGGKFDRTRRAGRDVWAVSHQAEILAEGNAAVS